MKPVLAIIAAVADNDVIGAAGAMPWRLSTDLKRFKQITMGKPVIVGRKTYESIGRPLPGRTNIVVTRDKGFRAEGARIVDNLEAALDLGRKEAEAAGVDEFMVIGGGELYRQSIGRAERLYITHVHAAPFGDTRFPPIDPTRWRAVSKEAVPVGEKDSAASDFTVYQRLAGDPV